MNDEALTSVLARLPAVNPFSPTLNLGATLKPTLLASRTAVRHTANIDRSAVASPSDTLERAGQPFEPGIARQPDGYEILDELGRGGMGIVYRARQRTLQREVAVKRLQSDDTFMRQAFLTESMVTGELEHPNIVPVYALCEEEESGLWLVMKRIGGRTLAQLIAEIPSPREAADIDRLLEVVLGVADALRFAHSRGILHRDIKPVNIMVGSFGEVMLLDWGIAAYFGDPAAAPHAIPHVRDLDMISGTPLYMPPEMAEGRGADCGPWSDVYLLGATLYEVIAGKPPRRAGTLMDVLTGVREPSPLKFGPTVPAELRVICRRALAHAPAARYPDIASFQTALRDYLDHRESRTLSKSAEDGLELWRTSTATGIDDANRPRLYRAISEVISSFQHAHLLWPQNTAARTGEMVARKAWASAALDGGDIGVAVTAIESVDDAEAVALRQRIDLVAQSRRRALRLTRWLGAGLMAAQLLLVTGLAVFGWIELRSFTQAEIVEELKRLAPAAAAALEMVDEVNPDRLDEVADALGRESDLHLVMVDIDGTVIADSDSEPGGVAPPVQSWPEVAEARRGVVDAWAEHPGVTDDDVLSLARPWRHVDGTEAVLVLSLPRNALDGSLHSVIVGGLVALMLSFLIWSLVVLRVSRRLNVSLSRIV
jgi:serine/threonine protein kinase